MDWSYIMDLDDLRKKIDDVDARIVELLNERYATVQEIGRFKRRNMRAVYVPEREKMVFEKVAALNKGPMNPQTLRAIYREIMSGALALEHPLTVAYLGPEGTFSHIAAVSKFGHSVAYLAQNTIDDIFNAVSDGAADYGCVPIENSSEGAVNLTLDIFTRANVQICSEINLRVHQSLLAKCEMDEIRTLYSHAQSLAQCRTWISENLPDVEIHECVSNARAASLAAREPGAAAIANVFNCEIYGLKALSENIEDNPHNTTRFLVIGSQTPKRTGCDKTSLCFALKDRVGVLFDALLPFKEEGITLSMIESRPSKIQNWEYYFFIDLLGHQDDENVARALDKLRPMTQAMRVLGSYPRGEEAK